MLLFLGRGLVSALLRITTIIVDVQWFTTTIRMSALLHFVFSFWWFYSCTVESYFTPYTRHSKHDNNSGFMFELDSNWNMNLISSWNLKLQAKLNLINPQAKLEIKTRYITTLKLCCTCAAQQRLSLKRNCTLSTSTFEAST